MNVDSELEICEIMKRDYDAEKENTELWSQIGLMRKSLRHSFHDWWNGPIYNRLWTIVYLCLLAVRSGYGLDIKL
jgi:hypothetical protein